MGIYDCLLEPKESLRQELNEAIDKKLKELKVDPNEFQATAAIRELTEDMLRQKQMRKRQEGLRILAFKGLLERMDTDDPARALMGVYSPDAGGRRQHSTIEIRSDSIQAENNGLMPTFAKLRPKIFRWSGGVYRGFNRDIMQAGLGRKTPNEVANQIAKEMREAISSLVDRFNAAGGSIHKLEGWFLPQTWNRDKVGRVTADDWVKEMMGNNPDTGLPLLDRSRMKDFATGKPLSESELEDLLRFVHESIGTDGINKWKETTKGKSSLANRRDAARILHFTDDGWMHVQSKYGDDDTINNFLNYRNRLAHDTAIMEILGPNPDWAFEKAMIVLEKKIGTDFTQAPVGFATTKQKLEYLHNSTMGITAPVDNHKTVQLDQAARSGTMAVLLQGAIIPSQADWSHQVLANVIQKTRMADRITEYIRFMGNSENKIEDALEDLIVADTVLSAAATTSRFDNALSRSNNFFSDRAIWTLEKSGLIAHTDAGRLGAINAHRRAIGRDLGKSWDELSTERKSLFDTYGITEEDWNVIKTTAPEMLPGMGRPVEILNFRALRDADRDVFQKVHEMILQEGKRAVISTDARAEARLDAYSGGLRDSLAWKHVKMFKRFTFAGFGSIESLVKNENIPGTTKAKAIASFAVTGIMLGAMALQAKQMMMGKDPLPMLDEDGYPEYRFWIAATLYAGVLPFIGDVVLDGMFGLSDTQEVGTEAKKWYELSPTLGVIYSNAFRPIGKTVAAVFGDDPEMAVQEAGKGAIGLGKLGAGLFGANHWAFKQAINQWIWEPLERLVTPDLYDDKITRRERYNEERGQDFWWHPDDALPDRSPTIRRAE